MKTSPELRELLEAEAAKTGRPLTQEVENILTKYFARQSHEEEWGGPEIEPVAKAIIVAARGIMARTGAVPSEDFETAIAIREAAHQIINARIRVPSPEQMELLHKFERNIAAKENELADLCERIKPTVSISEKEKDEASRRDGNEDLHLMNALVMARGEMPLLPNLSGKRTPQSLPARGWSSGGSGRGLSGILNIPPVSAKIRLWEALNHPEALAADLLKSCTQELKTEGTAVDCNLFNELISRQEEVDKLRLNLTTLINELNTRVMTARDSGKASAAQTERAPEDPLQ